MAVFTVNGQKVEPTGNQKLLRFLRDELHLTSVKDGCSEGACGACTVIIDGKTCKACVPDTDLLDGRTVITVEGLTEWEREVYTYAYGNAGAVGIEVISPIPMAPQATFSPGLSTTMASIFGIS